MKITAGLLASVIALGFAVPSHAAELPDRIKKSGKIVVATMPNYAPITFKDPATNKLTGFDIDLGEALAKELGVGIEWQEIAFAQMIPSLQTGRVDIALAGMSDLPARREIVDFIDYMKSGAQFYTSPAMAATIKTPEDLCGKKVGASRSTNWPRQIGEWSQANCVAKGKPAIEAIGTEGSADARTQLKTQRIDAAVQGNETLPYFQSQEPNSYVLIGEAFTVSLSGIPVLKTETQLRDAIKEGLERLQQKGIYDEIVKKYGLLANTLTPITINQGKD
jgi:polar amino acid transport system substrate-binding protein